MQISTDSTLAEELNININAITEDKYKTTDYIKVTFIYGLKVSIL